MNATGAFAVYQFNCPAGTIFNQRISNCDHIWSTVPFRPDCAYMLETVLPGGAGGSQGSGVGYPQSSYPGSGATPGVSCPQPGKNLPLK